MKSSRFFSIFSILLLLATLFGPGAQTASAGGAGVIFTVTSVNEGSDSILDGVCNAGGGVCTLRAAMEEANFDPNVNTIRFNLPGSGVHSISITAGPLPEIDNQLYLDGTSQPSCTVPCIVLSGASLGGLNIGLTLATDDSIIKGFIVTSWSNYGIAIVGNRNTIQSNDIGFWPGNPSLLPNGAGISILGANNLIGGTTTAQRNVISGNTSHGIRLANGFGIVTSGNTIQGNYLGTDETGMVARGNGQNGIEILADATYTVVGGTLTGSRNVISANGWSGIEVVGSHTFIRGNFIGTRRDGKGSLGNTFEGILVYGNSTSNIIGGTTGAARNRIAHNSQNGILITNDGPGRTAIRQNSIFSNALLGIDLGGNGVTPNDSLDADGGPNDLQNFPIVSSATSITRVIVAKLYSKPSTAYSIDFFYSPAGTCDPSTHGEGRTFLGSITGTTGATGYMRVVYTSPVGFPLGSVITATASNGGGTSEFSKCKTAQ